MASENYRINSPHVVAETLDGEATIVDLEQGIYYAINESGSLVWDRVINGVPRPDVIEALAGAYGLDLEDAERDVAELISKLEEAKLIVPADGAATNGAATNGTAANGGSANGASRPASPYAPPALSTYTDMQELLLLDPIHEVDESGWPSRR